MSAYVEQLAVVIAQWVIDGDHPVYETDLIAALNGRASAGQVHGAAAIAVERGWLVWAGRDKGRRLLDAGEGMR